MTTIPRITINPQTHKQQHQHINQNKNKLKQPPNQQHHISHRTHSVQHNNNKI